MVCGQLSCHHHCGNLYLYIYGGMVLFQGLSRVVSSPNVSRAGRSQRWVPSWSASVTWEYLYLRIFTSCIYLPPYVVSTEHRKND